MDNWKPSQHKAHQQWLLGRIDSLVWCQTNLKSLSAKDAVNLQERIIFMRTQERETAATINRLAEEKEQAKGPRKTPRRDGSLA